jgi:hypothetical protein
MPTVRQGMVLRFLESKVAAARMTAMPSMGIKRVMDMCKLMSEWFGDGVIAKFAKSLFYPISPFHLGFSI